MKTVGQFAFAAMAIVGLAACSSQPANDSVDTSTAAAAANTQRADPYGEAEARMSQAMGAAVGKDIGDTWTRMMIEHHQGAIDMSKVALQQNLSPDAAKMAQDTIDKQTKEIEHLRGLIETGTPNAGSAEPFKPAMKNMQQAMAAATGADPSEVFMRKMIAHHEGGVALSDVALRNGVEGHLKSHVKESKEGQQKDADMLRAMLGGQPMSPETKSRASASSASAGASGTHDQMSNMSNMKQH